MTILSVNKTRKPDGRFAPIFCYGRELRSFFVLEDFFMNKRVRYMAQAAVIAAMYVGLTHLQNLLIPNSASFAVQFRASEALCVLALFTPSAIPGLSIGCFLFNLTFAGALPLDPILGTLATFLATGAMYLLRRWPLPAMLMPALFNALLVGWELTLYIGNGFWLNAFYVALGEAVVLLTLGRILWAVIKKHGLDSRLFGDCNH